MDRSVAALATKQHGLITRAQLFTIGLTRRQIDHALDISRLSLVLPGVYRISGSALTDDHALAAGLLFTRGVASHRSAAHLMELIDSPPSHPEIIVGRTQSQKTAGLILHRSRDLVGADTLRIHGLRSTNATRTLIDLGAVVSDSVLESALERALHQRLTTVPRLQARLAASVRRSGIAALRRVLDLRAPRHAPTESELELLIWQILRRHRVPLPERQVEVNIGGSSYRLDLAYRSEMIFIEGDGFGVHSTRSAFESDRTRQNRLVIGGWLPLRFTWQQARGGEDDLAAQVRSALATRS
jgi:very-short-patch-repair endonuclease